MGRSSVPDRHPPREEARLVPGVDTRMYTCFNDFRTTDGGPEDRCRGAPTAAVQAIDRVQSTVTVVTPQCSMSLGAGSSHQGHRGGPLRKWLACNDYRHSCGSSTSVPRLQHACHAARATFHAGGEGHELVRGPVTRAECPTIRRRHATGAECHRTWPREDADLLCCSPEYRCGS